MMKRRKTPQIQNSYGYKIIKHGSKRLSRHIHIRKDYVTTNLEHKILKHQNHIT